MELSSSPPGCSSSPWAQSSVLSRHSDVSPATSPSRLQIELGISKGSDGTTRSSYEFIQELHSKLILVQAQRGLQYITRFRQSNRRSFRFSPYRRSRSLCYVDTRTCSLRQQRASQNHTRGPLPIYKSVSLPGVSLKRKFGLVAGSSENTGEGHSRKRPKKNDSSVTAAKTVIRSASLRKAKTLRKLTQSDINENDLVPTAPATPNNFSIPGRVAFSPVPIISPPLFLAPFLPLSIETAAKVRLGKYKEREGRTTDHDYMRCQHLTNGALVSTPSLVKDWEILLGLGKQRREERIDWLLQFTPRNDLCSSSSSFSSSSSTSLGSLSRLDRSMQGLIDQLATSPETRFHAAWMFLRYHHVLGLSRTRSVNHSQLPLYSDPGVWDVTLASLAISVKFHRDFLYPLVPVEAVDYMRMSPHNMEYEEFEYAQRAMLDAFSYELGVTPQPFLDQVWIALPSLRDILDFDGGWNQVKKETWWMLFNSVYEHDVMRFSVSILTAAALSKALVSVLAQRYHYQSDWNCTCDFTRAIETGKWGFRLTKRSKLQARDDVEGVVMDIQAVIGVSDVQISECSRWFEARSGLT